MTTSSSILKSTDLCGELYPFTKEQTLTKVKLATLDKAVRNLPNPLAPEILIKMDVQGYEGRVIEGGEETISKAKACIIEINLDSLYEGQPTFKEIFSLMDVFGFSYVGNLTQEYARDGHIIFIDAVFVKE